MKSLSAFGALGALTVFSMPVHADLIITGSGSGFGSSVAKAAEVRFATDANNLVVTLINTATTDVTVPADVLTAVFFDVSGDDLSLTRSSALLFNGSTVEYTGQQPSGGVVGGEWAYKSDLSGAPSAAHYGISSTGLNWFGPGDVFPGPNLAGPTSPDGVQYGLVSQGDDPATGNGGITGSGGLIKNSVQFRLAGLPDNFDVNRISNVFFLYGTSVGEGGFTPEPSTITLLVVGGWLAFRRRA